MEKTKKSPKKQAKKKQVKKLETPKQIEKEFYEKYRWFMTSSRKMVIGGKNAEQNEEIIKELLSSGKNYVVMHTKLPGSPFAIIQSENPNETDLQETAIFTACFSQRWKEKKKKVIIDIFKADQIYKTKAMKKGTFGVKTPIKHKTVEMKLYLTTQKSRLRAVPKDTISICPGKTSKEKLSEQIAIKLDIPHDEVLQALPTGGSKICLK